MPKLSKQSKSNVQLTQSSTKRLSPKRGEIWIVDLNPSTGDEMSKQRPVVVVGGEATGLRLTIIVPLTTWKDDFEKNWHIIPVENKASSGLQAPSGANCYQVRSISTLRFLKRLGTVSNTELQEITACVQNCVEM